MPAVGDKLMCGVEETARDATLVRWAAAACVGAARVLVAGESEPSDLPEARWMLESEYAGLAAAVALRSDADAKDDEELGADLIKRARGLTPQPRKPWGAVRAGGVAPGGASVIKRSFLVAKSMGLHLNSKTLEVVRVDPHSQGSAVRVGWRVVAVNGDATRNAYDLKHALAKLRDAPTTPGEQSARPAEVHGPPLAVRSGQVVRLGGDHDDGCRLSCQHAPKLAFRLDPDLS